MSDLDFDENGDLIEDNVSIDESKDDKTKDESSEVSELIDPDFFKRRKIQFEKDWILARILWIGQRKNKTNGKCEFRKWNNDIILLISAFVCESFMPSRMPPKHASSIKSWDNEELAVFMNLEIERKRRERRKKRQENMELIENRKLVKLQDSKKRVNKYKIKKRLQLENSGDR